MEMCVFHLFAVISLPTYCMTAMPPSISNLISNEDVLNMTLDFMELCPLTPLCKVNITDYQTSKLALPFPCCAYCKCDEECMERGDCCPDAFDDLDNNYWPLRKCVDFTYTRTLPADNTFKVTAACPVTYGGKDVAKKCEQGYKAYDFEDGFTGFLPVTDTIGGETYKNVYCLECNNGSRSEALHWSLAISCLHNNAQLVWTPHAIHEYAFEGCNVMFNPPEAMPDHLNVYPGSCHPIIDECNVTGNHEQFDERNERYCHAYDSKYKHYRNVHCALCYGLNRENITMSGCTPEGFGVGFWFTSVIDVPGLIASETLGHDETGSPAEESNFVYQNCTLASDISFETVINDISCIKRHCPKYEYLHGSKCKPLYKSSTSYPLQLMMRFYPKGKIKLSHDFLRSLSNITQAILDQTLGSGISNMYIVSSLYDIYVKIDEAPIFDINAMRKETEENPTVIYVELHIQIQGTFVRNVTLFIDNCLELFEADFRQDGVLQTEYVSTTSGLLKYEHRFEPKLAIQLHDDQRARFGVEHALVSNDNKLILYFVKKIPWFSDGPYKLVHLTNLIFCSQIVLDTTRFHRSMEKDGTIHISVTGRNVPMTTVVFDENYSYMAMCETDYEALVNPVLDIKSTEPPFDKNRNDTSVGIREEVNGGIILLNYFISLVALEAIQYLNPSLAIHVNIRTCK